MSIVGDSREWTTGVSVPSWAGTGCAPASLDGGSLVDNMRFNSSQFHSMADLSLAERGVAARMPMIRSSAGNCSSGSRGSGSGPPLPAGTLPAVEKVGPRRRAHADARVRRWQMRGPRDAEGGFAATNAR
jgi:hypothetical protein